MSVLSGICDYTDNILSVIMLVNKRLGALMDTSKASQKLMMRIYMFIMIFFAIAFIVQGHLLSNKILEMKELADEMNTHLISGYAAQLVVLKNVEHFYKNTNKGPENLEKIIEFQKNTVSSYLQDSNIPAQARANLENSLNCLPKTCRIGAFNNSKNRTNKAGTDGNRENETPVLKAF